MRGSLRQRYKGSWSLILDLGSQVDVETGQRKRKQKWVTFRGTRRDAERKLAELLHASHTRTWVEPSTVTVGDWLQDWLEKAIKPPRRTLRAYDTYKSAITRHLQPKLGAIRLQELLAVDIERYHATLGLAPATGEKHHAILNSALKAAVRADLVARNVAPLATNKPRAPEGHEDVLAHVWEAHEAKQFLATAKAAGAQPAAFYSLALETGMRKGELGGLRWSDLGASGTLTVQRQLVKPGSQPIFGPVKNKAPRQLELAPATVALLRTHRAHQAEIKLRNRQHYHDHGLMFAKEWSDLQRRYDTLGDPLQVNNLGQAGVPAHVVQQRSGIEVIALGFSWTLDCEKVLAGGVSR